MKNYSKLFKILMLVLIVVSVVLLVLGFVKGFETSDGKLVDTLLRWTYVMVGIAIFSAIIVGLLINIKNNPKSLIKLLIGLVAVAAICAIAYVLAPGNPAVALTTEQPGQSVLKLTDTILNLTYFAGGVAILSILVGEIVMAVRNK